MGSSDCGDTQSAIEGHERLSERAPETNAGTHANLSVENDSSLLEELERLRNTCEDLKRQCAEKGKLQNKCIKSDESCSKFKDEITLLKSDIKKKSIRIEELESEGRCLTELLVKKRSGLEKSYVEYSELQEELKKCRKANQDVKSEYHKLSLEFEDLKFKNALSLKEIEQLKDSNKWLTSSNEKKNKQILEIQNQKVQKFNELQALLDKTLKEKLNVESENHIFKGLIGEMEDRVKNLTKVNTENESHLVLMKSQFKAEMDSMSKLCEIYYKDINIANKTVEELQKDLQEKTQNFENENQVHQGTIQALRNELEVWKSRFSEQAESKDPVKSTDKGNSLGKALNSSSRNSNHLFGGKKSYTELYIDYENEKEARIVAERQVLICENRLKVELNRVKANEDRIYDLDQELKTSRNRNQLAFAKLTQTLREKDEIAEDLEEFKKKYSTLQTEHSIMSRDINDLIKQIRSIIIQFYRTNPQNITSVENYVNDLVSRYSSEDPDSYSDIEKEINENFTQLTGVEDLVRQAFSLRKFCRQVKQDYENKKAELDTERINWVTQELKNSREELENVKSELNKLKGNYEYVTKQRDDLQEMLKNSQKHRSRINREAHVECDDSIISCDEACSTVSNAETLLNQSTKKSTADESFYRKSYDECVKQFDRYADENGANIKILSSKLEELRLENTQKHIEVAKLKNQLDFQNEKHEVLMSDFDSQKRLNESLREDITLMINTLAKQDEKMRDLINQLTSESAKNGQLEAQNYQLEAQKKIWEESLNRISSEKKDIYLERNKLNEDLIEMRHKLSEITDSFNNEKKSDMNRLEESMSNLKVLRKELDDSREEMFAINELRGMESRESREKIQLQMDIIEKLRNELSELKVKEKNSSEELKKCLEKIPILEEELSIFNAPCNLDAKDDNPETEIKRLKNLLVQERKSNFQNREDIAALKEKEENLKELAKGAEKQLIDFNTSYDLYKENSEKKIKDLEDTIETQKKVISEFEAEICTLKESLQSLRKDSDAKQENYDKEVSKLNQIIRSLEISENAAKSSMEGAKNDIHRMSEELKDARNNYDREHILHSESLSICQGLKSEIDNLKISLNEEQKKTVMLESKLATESNYVQEHKLNLEQMIKSLEEKNKHLKEQNDLLHLQFSSLEKNVKVHRQDDSTEARDDNSLSELRELVTSVRKERDISNAKIDLLRSENRRLNTELDHIRLCLDQERANLASISENAEARLKSEEEHRKLLESIEQASILKESNSMLRIQLEKTNEELNSLRDSLSKINKEHETLKVSLIDAKAEVDVLKEEREKLIEESLKWKTRSEEILRDHKRIDPEEHESLKNQIIEAKNKISTLESEKAVISQEQTKLEQEKAVIDQERKKLKNDLEAIREKHNNLFNIARRQKETLDDNIQLLKRNSTEAEEKAEEINQLKERLKISQERLTESELKLQNTIQKANATMMQFKEKNRSLMEERKVLESQIASLNEKLNSVENTHEEENPQEVSFSPVQIKQVDNSSQLQKEKETGPSPAQRVQKKKANLDLLKMRYNSLMNKFASNTISSNNQASLQDKHTPQTQPQDPQQKYAEPRNISLQKNTLPLGTISQNSNTEEEALLMSPTYGITNKKFKPDDQSTNKKQDPNNRYPISSQSQPTSSVDEFPLEAGEISEISEKTKMDETPSVANNSPFFPTKALSNSDKAQTESIFRIQSAEIPGPNLDKSIDSPKQPNQISVFKEQANQNIRQNLSLTPNQRAQLLKRKLQAAEASIANATKSLSSPGLPPLDETNSKTTKGENEVSNSQNPSS